MDFLKAARGTLGQSHSQSAVCVHTCPVPFWALVKLGLAGLYVAVVPAVHIPVTRKKTQNIPYALYLYI